MSVIDMGLQEQIKSRKEMLEGAKRVKKAEVGVETETLRNYHARARAGEFTFDSDEPESKIGGTNRAPSPLEYFLAGFAFCLQAQYVRNAILMGVELDALSMEVGGRADYRDGMGLTDRQAAFDGHELQYTTHVESPAPAAEVRRLVEAAESCCYAHGTLQEPVTLRRRVVVDGEPLDS